MGCGTTSLGDLCHRSRSIYNKNCGYVIGGQGFLFVFRIKKYSSILNLNVKHMLIFSDILILKLVDVFKM